MKRTEYRTLKKARARRINQLVDDFKQTVRSEEDAIQFLIRLHQHHGDVFQCVCGNTTLPKSTCTRLTKCSLCERDWWLTAGTMFDRARNLQPYLIAIHLKMNGMDVTPGELANVTGVAFSTAFEILKKVSMVIVGSMHDQFQEFSSLSFLSIYQKRSVATPRFSHPRSEEEPIEFQQQENPSTATEDEQSLSLNLSPQNALVFSAISTEAISFNALLEITQLPTPDLSLSLLALQLDEELVDRLPGEQYRRRAGHARWQQSDQVGQLEEIESFVKYVTDLHQGIARKYAQLYAADYWCATDRHLWGNNALLIACLRSRPITRDDILEYVSPVNIRILPMARARVAVSQ